MGNGIPIVPTWSPWGTLFPSAPFGAGGERSSRWPQMEPMGNAGLLVPIWDSWELFLSPRGLKRVRRSLILFSRAILPAGTSDPTRALPARLESLPGARASSWTASSPDLPQAASGPVDRLSSLLHRSMCENWSLNGFCRTPRVACTSFVGYEGLFLGYVGAPPQARLSSTVEKNLLPRGTRTHRRTKDCISLWTESACCVVGPCRLEWNLGRSSEVQYSFGNLPL